MTRQGPLTGIRIADFTTTVSGPFCSRLLADCGAEVIKVEPVSGDPMRQRKSSQSTTSRYFGHINCGKRSLALDLKTDEGREIAQNVIQQSDVVLENFRPGVMTRLGLGYDEMSEKNGALIYCSISGFGQTGPRVNQPAYAPIIHAASGYDKAFMGYQTDFKQPPNTGIFVADILVAVYAFSAIQTALIGRNNSGQGTHIDVSLLDSMVSMLITECQEAQSNISGARRLYVPIRAKDDYVTVAVINQKNFDNLTEAIGRLDWREDPDFCTLMARTTNWKAFMAGIEEWTIQRSAKECEEILSGAGVPCSRYLEFSEVMEDPHVVERGTFGHAKDSSGEFVVTDTPFKFSNGEVGIRPHVAELGEDTQDLLRSLLSLSDDKIEALRKMGVVNF